MFFKKHLAALIIIAGSLMAFASVVCLVSVQMKQSALIAKYAKQESDDLAYKVALRVAAKNSSEEEKNAKALEDCQQNVEERLKRLKTIDLPDDLLKNAVWKVTATDMFAQADFSYNNIHGTVNFLAIDPGTSFAKINYLGKQILVSAIMDSNYNSNPTPMPVRDYIGTYFCNINPNDGEIVVNDKIVVPDTKYDNPLKLIEGPGKNQKAKLVNTFFPNSSPSEVTTTAVYNDGKTKMMFNELNGYFVVLATGRFSYYDSYTLSDIGATINIANRKETLNDYEAHSGGSCGISKLNIVSADVIDLKEVGVASNGDKLYVYKDLEKVRQYYDTVYYPELVSADKISFETFVADQPYFIWFDGFGSAIQYKKIKYQPAAECGKPVIYLYPEKDMNISVKVEPNGGFKFTEPAYNYGWNVWATTKSELTNTTDGASYPYLFWEGKAYNYQTPDKGFVLMRENVGRDMNILLSRLGLNEKETADFMEFWQPKLEVKPFVYVTFLPQTEFDKLAPLTVVPAPDKVIRVFMDYEPLDKFVNVPPLKITTPTRTGFTVVEWGGRLR